MKQRKEWRVKSVITLLLLVLGFSGIQAQTIIDDLQSDSKSSEGVIRIESDPAITALIGLPNGHVASGGNYEYIERQGFRIQVFMGNNAGTARSEASSRQSAIKESFPDMTTYLTYNSPNWKLVVGDFISRDEANVVKQQIQKSFPNFGKEMYIVADKIKVPVSRDDSTTTYE